MSSSLLLITIPSLSYAGSTPNKTATKEHCHPETNTRQSHLSDDDDDFSVEQEAKSLGSNDTSEDDDSMNSDKEDDNIEDIEELEEGMVKMSVKKAQAMIMLPMLM